MMDRHVLAVATIVLLAVAGSLFSFQKDISERNVCFEKVTQESVRGTSMSPLIQDGQTITALYGYYRCNNVSRYDVILYNFSANENPLLKRVVALPGDRFGFQQTENGWHLIINGEKATTSENTPYVLTQQGKNMLNLYWNDYNGTLPQDHYIILGDQIHGTLDSTRFGIVNRKDLIAKAKIE